MTPPDEKNSKKSLNVFRSRSNFLTFPKKLFSKFWRRKRHHNDPLTPSAGGPKKKFSPKFRKIFSFLRKIAFFGAKRLEKQVLSTVVKIRLKSDKK